MKKREDRIASLIVIAYTLFALAVVGLCVWHAITAAADERWSEATFYFVVGTGMAYAFEKVTS